jgi:hypothetical protein
MVSAYRRRDHLTSALTAEARQSPLTSDRTHQPMIPKGLLRTGSYAIVRTGGRDEDHERVVPLAGEPWREADIEVRKALSFGMITGAQCADNKGLRECTSGVRTASGLLRTGHAARRLRCP